MSSPASTPMNSRRQSFPRRGGKIKIKIIKDLFRSAVTIATMVTKKGRKRRETRSDLSSGCTTPAATPSGYNSDRSWTH
ncbi:hypothetical protein SLE2022_284480 [Rubroshorea leprosula]